MPFLLDGSVADGDIDFANEAARVVGGMPGVPDLSGELIVVHPNAYYRTYGQTQYTEIDDSLLSINPALNSNSVDLVVNELLTLGADESLSPRLVGIENEPSGPAYHVTVDIPASKANDTLGAVGSIFAGGTLNVWVTADSNNWLERMEWSQADQTAGAAAIRLVLSQWNAITPIEVPPAIQIAEPSF